MPNLNKVQIIGNVGQDPELRYTPNGNPVCTFSVAVNRRYSAADGEKREETEWFNIVAWNKLAETINQFVNKGMSIYVEGRLKTRNWEGQDGQKHYKTEVIAQQVQFLSRRAEEQAIESKVEDEGGPEDIPF